MSTGIQNTYKLHNDEIENQDIKRDYVYYDENIGNGN